MALADTELKALKCPHPRLVNIRSASTAGHVRRNTHLRAESMDGKRLNPRKVDLHRWRETFAERLRGYEVEAEATRQATRRERRRLENLWWRNAQEEGRLRNIVEPRKSGEAYQRSRIGALDAWAHIVAALRASEQASVHELARRISSFIRESTYAKENALQSKREMPERPRARVVEPVVPRDRPGPEIRR